MTKLLLGVLAAFLLGIAGVAAAGTLTGGDDPPEPRSVSVGTTTTDDAEDIPGPCDEAEHANDPRCTGTGTTEDDDDDDDHRRGRGRDDDGDDRSGSNSGRH